MRIIVFGTYQADSHPRVRVLIEGLRAAGHSVVEINQPLGLSTADRVAMLNRPWTVPAFGLRMLRLWATLWRRGRAEAKRARPDAVLVGYLGHFDVHLAKRVFRGTPIILDHLIFAAGTAIDRGKKKGLLTGILDLVDRRAMYAADVILVDTAEHLARVPPPIADRALVVQVGSDESWFAAGEHAAPDPGPGEPVKILFFGLFTPLQGAPVIGAALAKLDALGFGAGKVSVTMIGSGQDLDTARAAAGRTAPVEWISWMGPDDLPAIAAAHHISLGIFGTTPKGAHVVPNKVYQSAAAGCAIITSDTTPQRLVLGDSVGYARAGDPDALAAAIAELLVDRDKLAARRRQARELAMSSFHASSVIEPLLARLDTAGSTAESALTTTPVAPLTPRAALRWPLIKRALEQVKPRSVLEIGCGQGAMGARLVALTESFVAVEPDTESAIVAASRIEPRGGEVINGLSTALAADRNFDMVAAFEVLEHIEDDEAALLAWREQVAPGGHLLLSVPAWQHLFSPSDTAVGHFRRYSPAELTDKLRAAGFEPVRVQLYGWPLVYMLEAVRSRLARTSGKFGESKEDQSAESGRWLQPSGKAMSIVISVGILPFQGLQRLFSDKGNGIVALARRAD